MKVRDIHKVEKKNSMGSSFFGYENKEKHPIYVSKKCCEERHADLLLIGKEYKRNYALIKDFNTFMYDQTLHCGRKYFCRYCLQAFSSEEILKRHIKYCLKINAKQRIIMPKKGEYVKLKNYERIIKSPFIIREDFESILVPEDIENKIQKSLMQKNIRSILVAVMAINKYVFIISLISLLR